MTLLAPQPTRGTAAHTPGRVAELQARINGMQSAAPPSRAVPLRADLAALLPAGLREGAVYEVRGSTSLTTVALAEASVAGRWVAWLGWPNLGAEAIASAGVRLDRTAVIPNPGQHWLAALSSLADAMNVIAVRPPRGAKLAPSEVARLAGRLRERGTTLLVDADWPGAQAQMRVEQQLWAGIGAGSGLLLEQRLRVSVRDHSGRVRTGFVGVTEALEPATRAFAQSATHATAPERIGPIDWAVSA